jgi:hypothetical protein
VGVLRAGLRPTPARLSASACFPPSAFADNEVYPPTAVVLTDISPRTLRWRRVKASVKSPDAPASPVPRLSMSRSVARPTVEDRSVRRYLRNSHRSRCRARDFRSKLLQLRVGAQRELDGTTTVGADDSAREGDQADHLSPYWRRPRCLPPWRLTWNCPIPSD